jgi:hypothetical protein
MSVTTPVLPSVCIYDLHRVNFTLTLCSLFAHSNCREASLWRLCCDVSTISGGRLRKGLCRMSNSTVTAVFSTVTSCGLSVRLPIINSAGFVLNLCNFVRCRIFCLSVYPKI